MTKNSRKFIGKITEDMVPTTRAETLIDYINRTGRHPLFPRNNFTPAVLATSISVICLNWYELAILPALKLTLLNPGRTVQEQEVKLLGSSRLAETARRLSVGSSTQS